MATQAERHNMATVRKPATTTVRVLPDVKAQLDRLLDETGAETYNDLIAILTADRIQPRLELGTDDEPRRRRRLPPEFEVDISDDLAPFVKRIEAVEEWRAAVEGELARLDVDLRYLIRDPGNSGRLIDARDCKTWLEQDHGGAFSVDMREDPGLETSSSRKLLESRGELPRGFVARVIEGQEAREAARKAAAEKSAKKKR
jgi:hypothetical protein